MKIRGCVLKLIRKFSLFFQLLQFIVFFEHVNISKSRRRRLLPISSFASCRRPERGISFKLKPSALKQLSHNWQVITLIAHMRAASQAIEHTSKN